MNRPPTSVDSSFVGCDASIEENLEIEEREEDDMQKMDGWGRNVKVFII